VVYGTTTGYGSSSAYDDTASTTHSVTLTSLAEGTLYHFAVKSGNVTATGGGQRFSPPVVKAEIFHGELQSKEAT